MASDMNRVYMIGRLTRDVDLRYTNNGTPVASFSIANNRLYKKDQEKIEDVSYFNCIAWSKLGELVSQYCSKGSRLAIDGRLQQRRWRDSNDNLRHTIEVVVDNLQFLDSAKKEDVTSQPDTGQPSSLHDGEPVDNVNNPFNDSDIPC
jgi:single-strand DNA-binding protein